VAALRTLRFQLNARMGPDMNISLSTEVIVGDDPDEIETAGQNAMIAMTKFMAGIGMPIKDDDDA
jgi:hypothetical protein